MLYILILYPDFYDINKLLVTSNLLLSYLGQCQKHVTFGETLVKNTKKSELFSNFSTIMIILIINWDISTKKRKYNLL